MRRNFIYSIMIVFLIMLTSIPAQAANIIGWLRQWELDLSSGAEPPFTVPANRLVVANKYSESVMYDTPTNYTGRDSAKFTINVPVKQQGNLVWGVGYAKHLMCHADGVTWHAFARKELGLLVPYAYAGVTVYTHKNNITLAVGNMKYIGNSTPAITLSAGLKMRPFKNLFLQAEVIYTGSAVVASHEYTLSGQPYTLPADYTEPVVTFHPNTAIYIGGGLRFDIMPSIEGIRKGRAAMHEHFLSRAVDQSVPSQYRTFTIAVAESLANAYGKSILTNDNAGAYWLPDDNILVLHLDPSVGYFRNTFFIDWMNDETALVDSLYTDFDKDVFQKIFENINEQVRKYDTVPPRLRLLIKFDSYNQYPTKKTLVWDPRTRRYVFVETPGECYDYRHYIAQIESQVDKNQPSGLQVLSMQTYLTPDN